MCGILGACWNIENDEQGNRLNLSLGALRHRGPDDQVLRSFQVSSSKDKQIHFGHTRLSILDLSVAGRQPMDSPCGRYTVVFNGEIYNFKELREELRSSGFQFSTETDTEVLLAAWAAWGQKSVPRFVGMFAFALLDHQTACLFCVRDAFGIKPFFFSHSKGRHFTFASELPALMKLNSAPPQVNKQRLQDYILFGTIDDGEETFINNYHHLRPGQLLHVNLKTLVIKRREQWWQPNITLRHSISFKDAAERLRELFLRSVSFHLRSDVPVGAALSGGIDSSAIVCAMRMVMPDMPIHTFSYIPDDISISEERWVDEINLHVGAISHKVEYSDKQLEKDLTILIHTQGEPFNSTSMYAQYCIFSKARECGIPVILEGQGADELLGGYQGYPGQRMRSLLEQGQFSQLFHFAKSWSNNPTRLKKSPWNSFFGQLLPDRLHNCVYLHKQPSEVRQIFLNTNQIKRKWQSRSLRNRSENVYGRRLVEALAESLTENALPSLLRYGDRNAMYFSVENRVPFLTTEIADFMLGLPENYLVSQSGESKFLFKAAMRGIVPDSILNRKDKIGFYTPMTRWLNNSLDVYSGHIREFSSAININTIPIIKRWQCNDGNYQCQQSYLMWRLLNASLWYQDITANIKF